MKGLRQIDGSTIWQDGSRTYPAGMNKAKDPPGTYPYPPPMGGIPVEVAGETPAQGGAVVSPPLQAPTPGPVLHNPGPFPPGIEAKVLEVEPLPAGASPADVWDRWQKLVINWNCLIAWGGGSLDKLTAAIGDMPMYQKQGGPPGQPSKTAIGWWATVVSAGYDKATAPADLGKGMGIDTNDVAVLIGQLNDLGALARAKGYAGCPPPPAQNPTAPPAAPTPLATAQGWWNNLSPGGKVVTGVAALGVLGLIVRGAAK